MERKPYRIDVSGYDVAETTVYLTPEEADAFAYVASALADAGRALPGAPRLTIEEAE